MHLEISSEVSTCTYTCTVKSIQFNSVEFNSIQFNSIQFNSIQFQFKWIFQHPVMIKSCSNFSKTLSVANESLGRIRMDLHCVKLVFIILVVTLASSRLHVNQNAICERLCALICLSFIISILCGIHIALSSCELSLLTSDSTLESTWKIPNYALLCLISWMMLPPAVAQSKPLIMTAGCESEFPCGHPQPPT